MLNRKILAFANWLGIYHCVFGSLSSNESLPSESYVVATHVRLDHLSFASRVKVKVTMLSSKFGYSFYILIKVIKLYHLLFIPV